MRTYTVEQSSFAHFFTNSTKSAPFWLIVRLYVGYEFFMAGWEKVVSPMWFGSSAGAALQGFVNGAVAKTVCAPGVAASACHPDVQTWYAAFLQSTVLPHLVIWSNFVALGELAVGLGLVVGLFTGVAAFFGFFMSMNYLFAGTVSINPILVVLAFPLVLAWRVAGYWGLDYYAQPYLRRLCRSRKNR